MPSTFIEILTEYFSDIKRKRAKHRCLKRGENWKSYLEKNSKTIDDIIREALKRPPIWGSRSFDPWVGGPIMFPLIWAKRKRSYIRWKKSTPDRDE